jgi:hypothetical protein
MGKVYNYGKKGASEMRRKSERKRFLTLPLCLLLGACAQSAPITIAIQADINAVSDPCGHLEGKITPGGLLTGYYTYESITGDSDPSSDGGEYLWNTSPFGIFLSGGGLDFQTDSGAVNFVIGILDNFLNRDSYVVSSHENMPLENGTSVDEIFWQLEDSTMLALDSDALPTDAPDLNAWDENYLYITGGPRGMEFSFSAEVTSATVVPEPLSITLLVMGVFVIRTRFAW